MRFNHLLLMGGLAITVAATSCGDKTSENASGMTHNKDFKYIDRSNMDTTILPGDDFFEYANGTWLKNTKIPSDKTRWGSFDELRERTDSAVYKILQDAKAGSSNRVESNVAKFYKSGMDTAAINTLGINAIKPELDQINSINNQADFVNVVTDFMKKGLGSVIGMYISPDDKDVTKEIAQFGQTGLGLPNKDYYTDKDENSVKNRAAYVDYITNILTLSGQDAATAKANATKVFNIENQLASASLRPQEMRDPQRMYNKFTLTDFTSKTPNLNWADILTKLNVKGQDTILVGTPAYYTALGNMLSTVPMADWKQYLTFHTISDMAPFLGDKLDQAHFNFYGKTLSGQQEQEPRWQRVKSVINGTIGDDLGQLYVDKNFDPDAKKKMLELVNNLQEAFKERIQNLDWMSDVTKQKAIVKLNAFVKKIGYPDNWKNYDGLNIADNNYAQNVINASVWDYNYQLSKLGKPVDRTEWGMTPNTVNAYYNPAFNEIVFPAAILQFPFFDFGADDAVNYGGIGAVIGHEMTHGFDDQGAQYGADGNLSNWWTPEDAKKFKEKTQILVNQYNKFEVAPGVFVNGELTLGENIADLGGINIAYQAFKKTKQGQSTETIDGFTPDQRFFLSWAQVWRGKATPQRALQLIKTDPHSPSAARADIPLSNFEPFYKAFDVKEGQKMYRPENERAKIW